MKQTLLSLFILIGFALNAQTVDPVLASSLQQILNTNAQNSGSIGLSASVILQNGEVWNEVVGFSNPQANEAMETNMQSCFASITKTFVAAQILWMEEEGLLSLDDAIGAYLTPMTHVNSLITIRQLLNHTSGVFNYTNAPNLGPLLSNNLSYNWSHAELIEFFVNEPVFSPGATWGYSNTNYILLAMIIETIQNDKWGNQVKINLLNPLGLSEIQLPIEEPLNGPVAVPWMDLDGVGGLDNGSVVSVDSAYASMRCAAGGLYSTAEQIATWGKSLYQGDVLSAAQLQKMLDFIPLPNVAGWNGYGLGTMRFILPDGKTMYGHNGGVSGYSSALRYSPECGISISVVSNENISNPHVIARELMIEACDFITTGIEETNLEIGNVKIYPNPIESNSILSYQVVEATSIEILVINMLGQVMSEMNQGVQQPDHYALPLRELNLPEGIYSVILKTSTGSWNSQNMMVH